MGAMKVLGLLVIALAALPTSAKALIDPLPIISHFESANGSNTSCSSTGACGIFQDVASTWREALTGIGIDPSIYTNANMAPPSVQIAANNWLINNRGLQPWVCSGCDVAFTAYVNSHGGVGAFQTSGLDTNVGDFILYDTNPGALQTYLNSEGAGSGGDNGLSPPAPPGTAQPSASSLPFEWVYNQVFGALMTQIDTSINRVETLASGPATALLALAIAIMGFYTLFGNMDMSVFLAFAIRAAIVMTFIQVGNTFYSRWVEQLVLSIPVYFQSAFSTQSVSGANPAQILSQIANGWFASAEAVWHSAGWAFHAVWVAIIIALMTVVIVLPSLAVTFVVFLVSTFLLLLALTVGPFMILALLFQQTRRFFHAWVNVMVTGAIFALVVDIVLSIFSNILIGILGQFSPSGSPSTDLTGLFGLSVAMFVTGAVMSRLPRMVETIGGGVTVGLDKVGQYAQGGFAMDAARAIAQIVRAIR